MAHSSVFFILFIIATTKVYFVMGQDCPSLANSGDCTFYKKCVEKQICCGPRFYPVGFGDKFCKRFENEMSCFTAEGKEWVSNSWKCLMQSLVENDVYKNATSCKGLEMLAFDRHTSCYIDNRFCNYVMNNFDNMNCLGNIFNEHDSLTKAGIDKLIDTATFCSVDNRTSFLASVPIWLRNETSNRVSRRILRSIERRFEGCRSGLDLMFVLDASGSVNEDNFELMLQFVINTIRNFDISNTKTRVGAIRFEDTASVVIPLGAYNTKDSLITAINNIAYTGGYTHTDLALRATLAAFENNTRQSQGIPQVALVLTDGHSTNPFATIEEAAKVRDARIQVFSVGVGDGVNNEELVSMSFSQSEDYVFHIENFKTFSESLVRIQTQSCAAPAPVSINEAIETSLSLNEARHFQIFFGDNGTTTDTEANGTMMIHYSCSVQNPDDSTADYTKIFKDRTQFYAQCDEPVSNCIPKINRILMQREKRQIPPQTQRVLYISLISLSEQPAVITFKATEGDSLARNEICRLQPKTGPCKALFTRWFFNSSSSQCELFVYGGCQGNENRFGTLDKCINFCGCSHSLEPEECSPSVCLTSSCPDYPNAVCHADVCSDCFPRYFTRTSEVTEVCDACTLPEDPGPCSNSTVRWYYDSDSEKCQQFTYGGCDGNSNNFQTIEECIGRCGKNCKGIANLRLCQSNACDYTRCPNVPDAYCVSLPCEGCVARFYNSSGDEVTSRCFSGSDGCPNNRRRVECSFNPCSHVMCRNFPDAECEIDNCGKCQAKFVLNGTDVTEQCTETGICEVEGTIFKRCGSTCRHTCNNRQADVVCLPFCVPGCECPAGQVVDEENDKCVYPEDCPCPECNLPSNCNNIITLNNTDSDCNCPICADCNITGQVYQPIRSCPKTCTNPNLMCAGDVPGCGCPPGQVIDEEKDECVDVIDCPKMDKCRQPLVVGPCQGQIQRYFFNSQTQKCQAFFYGGCYGNENNFFSLHACEEQCSSCPPTCSRTFCSIRRKAICSLPTNSLASSNCTGPCVVTNCQACYYSYNPLPLPGRCPAACSNPAMDTTCMRNWGNCVRSSYYQSYQTRLAFHELIDNNFYCWGYPCN